jgi:hypothetical protein
VQSSLPAGWLAFAGRESNPLDRYEWFQIMIFLPSCSPDATACRCAHAGYEVAPDAVAGPLFDCAGGRSKLANERRLVQWQWRANSIFEGS